MKFLVTTDKNGAPVSVKVIDGESRFEIAGGIVAASVSAQQGALLTLNLNILADDVQFIEE